MTSGCEVGANEFRTAQPFYMRAVFSCIFYEKPV